MPASTRRARLLLTASTALVLLALPAVPSAADSGLWTTPQQVSPDEALVSGGGVWEDPEGGLLTLWTATVGGLPQVFARERPAGGPWSPAQQVTTATGDNGFTWAVGTSGTAAVVWRQPGADNPVLATVRGPDGSWSSATLVGYPSPGQVGRLTTSSRPTVAVGDGGQVTVAFQAYEDALGLGESGPDYEIFANSYDGIAWYGPVQVSDDPDPTTYPICSAPDPDDCPDYEGNATSPAAAYDGNGERRIAYAYTAGPDEADAADGLYLSTPAGDVQLASGGSSYAVTMAGDPTGGFVTAWRVIPAGEGEYQTWARSERGADIATTMLTPVADSGAIRSVAMRGGLAAVVVGIAPSGVDGSRRLRVASRAAGGAWSAPVAPIAGDGVARGGTAVIDQHGIVGVGFVRGGMQQQPGYVARRLGGLWETDTTPFTQALPVAGSLGSFTGTADGRLVAGWRHDASGTSRIYHGATSAGSGPTTPQPPADSGPVRPVVRLAVPRKPTTRKKGRAVVTITSPAGRARPTGRVVLRATKGRRVVVVTGRLREGVVTLRLKRRAAGTWRLVASYSGDALYLPAVSPRVKVKVR